MTLTINTNISSLIAQRSLNNATNSLNRSIERMTTGYTINHAKDNAAGYSIASMWNTQISSLDVAADNAATGADLLTTAEETYSLLTSHLQRVRDLTEQAANGTYGSNSLKAIQSEIHARLQEVSRISANSEFNGIKLMAYNTDPNKADENVGLGMTANGLNLQVGLYSNENSNINLAVDLFSNASISGLFNSLKTEKYSYIDPADGTTKNDKTLADLLTAAGLGADATLNSEDGLEAMAAACSGLVYTNKDGNVSYALQDDAISAAKYMLGFIDNAIDDISARTTAIGAAQNRIDSALTALDVQSQNLISSLSTLRDTDVASESSNFLQAQILQQASATLLVTANQTPQMALNLI